MRQPAVVGQAQPGVSNPFFQVSSLHLRQAGKYRRGRFSTSRKEIMRQKRFATGIIAALLASGALVSCSASTGEGSGAGEPTAASSQAAPQLSNEERSEKLVPQGARTLTDPAEAEATLVLFTDYQCPYCSAMDDVMEQVQADYGDRVQVVVRNFPLPKHAAAVSAAQAVEAAAEQGQMEEMSDLVFENQTEWSEDGADSADMFTGYAQSLGLDTEQFQEDMKSPEIADRVSNDVADGQDLGVRGTPTLVLEDQILKVDPSDYSTLSEPLDQELAD